MHLDGSSKDSVIEVFAEKELDKLISYFENNGFPTNEIALKLF